MKKYIWLLVIAVVIALVFITLMLIPNNTTAANTDLPQTTDAPSETKEPSETNKQNIDFTADYVRTGSYVEENYYPIVKTITSYNALTEYYENNKDTYYLGSEENIYHGLLDVANVYTEDFFKENGLVFVILEEPSGSIRHSVEYVNVNNGIMDIGIDRIIPEVCTDDMAIWHIIVALDKDAIPESEENIRIFSDGKEMAREYFDFFIRWNTYGISSYDSRSGLLIKTNDTDHPEDYITACFLSEGQMKNICNIIEELDILSYPDEYNPHGRGVSMPYMTLELTVITEKYTKTVSVPETVLSFEADNKEGQQFLNSVGAIIDIITNTDEWKELPEFDKFYD